MVGGPCGCGELHMQVIVRLPGPNCWWWETGSKRMCLGEILQEYDQTDIVEHIYSHVNVVVLESCI